MTNESSALQNVVQMFVDRASKLAFASDQGLNELLATKMMFTKAIGWGILVFSIALCLTAAILILADARTPALVWPVAFGVALIAFIFTLIFIYFGAQGRLIKS